MRSREEFIRLFQDELRGYAVAAFAKEWATSRDALGMAEKGRWMAEQMRSATDLLGRMYDAIADEPVKPPEPEKNGKVPVKR